MRVLDTHIGCCDTIFSSIDQLQGQGSVLDDKRQLKNRAAYFKANHHKWLKIYQFFGFTREATPVDNAPAPALRPTPARVMYLERASCEAESREYCRNAPPIHKLLRSARRGDRDAHNELIAPPVLGIHSSLYRVHGMPPGLVWYVCSMYISHLTESWRSQHPPHLYYPDSVESQARGIIICHGKACTHASVR